jgi:hypothetical protein
VNMIGRALAVIAAALAAGPALAQDYPSLRPGLWQVQTRISTQKADEPPLLSTMCLDAATTREMLQMGQGMMAGMCSRFEVKRDGNRWHSDAVCKLGDSTMTSRSTMTVTGDSAYRIEGSSTYVPPFMGMAAAKTTVDAKHAGACKPGQKPGDITTASGQTINIRSLGAPPKK